MCCHEHVEKLVASLVLLLIFSSRKQLNQFVASNDEKVFIFLHFMWVFFFCGKDSEESEGDPITCDCLRKEKLRRKLRRNSLVSRKYKIIN